MFFCCLSATGHAPMATVNVNAFWRKCCQGIKARCTASMHQGASAVKGPTRNNTACTSCTMAHGLRPWHTACMHSTQKAPCTHRLHPLHKGQHDHPHRIFQRDPTAHLLLSSSLLKGSSVPHQYPTRGLLSRSLLKGSQFPTQGLISFSTIHCASVVQSSSLIHAECTKPPKP